MSSERPGRRGSYLGACQFAPWLQAVSMAEIPAILRQAVGPERGRGQSVLRAAYHHTGGPLLFITGLQALGSAVVVCAQAVSVGSLTSFPSATCFPALKRSPEERARGRRVGMMSPLLHVHVGTFDGLWRSGNVCVRCEQVRVTLILH